MAKPERENIERATYRTRLGNHRLAVTCRSDFEDNARAFLETIVELGTGPDSTVYVGGLPFRIVARESNELEVLQPDYLAPDYLADDGPSPWVPDVSASLVLITEQLRVAQTIGVSPCDYRIDDTIVVLEEAIRQERFYMVRQEAPSPNDSGWFLGCAEDGPQDHAPANYLVVPLSALFRLRPVALRVVALPSGFLARFQGEALVGVGNERDEEVYRKRG